MLVGCPKHQGGGAWNQDISLNLMHHGILFCMPFHLGGDASLGATPRSARKHETRITSPTHKCASWAQGTQTLFLAGSSMWTTATNPAGAGRGRIRREKKKLDPSSAPVLPTPILRVLVARMWGDEDEIKSLGSQSLLGTNEKKKKIMGKSKLEKGKKAFSTLKYGET